MAEIKQLKEGDKVIYPLTSTKAIVDEQGNRVSIPTNTSELVNDAQYATKEEVESLIQESIINVIHSDL